MRRWLPVLLTLVFVCATSQSYAVVVPNTNAKWAMGWVDSDTCCNVVFDECSDFAVSKAPTFTPLDIYIVGADVDAMDGTRYGLCVGNPGNIFFYGWTTMADALNDETAGWPGDDEGTNQGWSSSQAGPFVKLGVLHIYAYGNAKICICPDPRTGYAEWRDGASFTRRRRGNGAFGCVGIGDLNGYNPCGNIVAVEQRSWGAIKAMYSR